jgi:hypothetical protein
MLDMLTRMHDCDGLPRVALKSPIDYYDTGLSACCGRRDRV